MAVGTKFQNLLITFIHMITNSGDFIIDTDKSKLDISFIHAYLTRSYWAEGIPVETVERSVDGSLCFGIYHSGNQIGFARVITDTATFAYLADVFIDENYRGKGLSKWLMKVIMEHESVQGLRRFTLATRDAHGLYKQFGFTEITNPERLMQIVTPNVYKKKF
jgi:N-acetylglutamate synthase-like GNAT family acetyltransferase